MTNIHWWYQYLSIEITIDIKREKKFKEGYSVGKCQNEKCVVCIYKWNFFMVYEWHGTNSNNQTPGIQKLLKNLNMKNYIIWGAVWIFGYKSDIGSKKDI